MKKNIIFIIVLLVIVTVTNAEAYVATIFTADFEDGEVNSGRIPLTGLINTLAYPSTQPATFADATNIDPATGDAYGWQNRPAGAVGGDTTIVNTVFYTGNNCAKVENRTLRSDIPITIEEGVYSFRFWYMIPSGNSLTFNNKLVMKDETNEYWFHIPDEDITAPANDIWFSRTLTFDTADYPDYTHIGEVIDFRFGIWMYGKDGIGGVVIPEWYGYTDSWELTITLAGEIVIEDFIGYTDTTNPADSNNLHLTWVDGLSNSTGSTISMETLGQTMKFEYDNSASPHYSESIMDFAPAQHWAGNMKYMEIYLFGDADNGQEPLYVELSDSDSSAIVICPDSQAILASHQVWNIDLAEFSSNGIDLTDVVSMAVGCGDKQSPQAGGAGTIYFDSIKLFASDCVEGYKPAADFTGDCTVNMDDLYEILKVWLLGDYEANATMPDSNGIVAHYAFDELTGTVANDSSDNDYHATVDISNGWGTGGYLNGCLNFNGSFGVTVPVDVFNDINQQFTIAAWLTLADANDIVDGEIPLMFGAGPASPDPNQWDVIYTQGEDPYPYTGQWLHVAVTKDSNVMNVYYNGLLVGQLDDASAAFDTSEAGVTQIGANASGMTDYHQGKMDEVRIYDYALSQEEVIYLALGSSGNLTQPMQPVLSPIDPVSDGIINLKDFAELAQLWLEE